MFPALDYEPDPNSVVIMSHIDRMSKPMRELVREFGYKIVNAMILDGYRNAKELKPMLEVWRDRRQEEWLETQYFTRRSAQSIADAVEYKMQESAAA